jgi:predicted RNA-binding Zn ribbon-like protein
METPETTKLLGGTLCLHFTNTADWTDEGEPFKDVLVDPDSLVRWGRRLEVLGGGGAVGGGEAAGAGAPPVDAGELAAARDLRPRLRDALIAASHGDSPDLGFLQRTYAEAVAAARLVPGDGGYAFDWPDEDPRKVRFAVVVDAVDLLRDARRLERVHLCPGRDCGWLFLNASGRQKWCSMATCGSRAKMRALYARRLQEG